MLENGFTQDFLPNPDYVLEIAPSIWAHQFDETGLLLALRAGCNARQRLVLYQTYGYQINLIDSRLIM